MLTLDVQHACSAPQNWSLPDDGVIASWIETALQHLHLADKELTLRFVDNEESQALNAQYRGKDKPTNVLSFPFECPPNVPLNLIGDLVIAVPVVTTEAEQQGKPYHHHLAHLVIHGTLHLLGYDHIEDEEAEQMENLERALLAKLGIDDPYQDD